MNKTADFVACRYQKQFGLSERHALRLSNDLRQLFALFPDMDNREQAEYIRKKTTLALSWSVKKARCIGILARPKSLKLPQKQEPVGLPADFLLYQLKKIGVTDIKTAQYLARGIPINLARKPKDERLPFLRKFLQGNHAGMLSLISILAFDKNPN